jgi:hypothetical protein
MAARNPLTPPEPVFRQALLCAVVFVRQELARHDEADAVAFGMREAVNVEVEVITDMMPTRIPP